MFHCFISSVNRLWLSFTVINQSSDPRDCNLTVIVLYSNISYVHYLICFYVVHTVMINITFFVFSDEVEVEKAESKF